MYDRILVPLDGSPAAATALAYAELIPSRRVRLLRVEPDDRGPMLADTEELAAWRAERVAAVRAELLPIGQPLARQGREIETICAFGDPARQIAVAAGDADLIVMVSRGRGAGGRALLGGVTDRVVRTTPVTTLVVRAGNRPAAGPPVARLVVPLDGSPLADRALPEAVRLADDLGLPVHLLRVADRDTAAATAEAARYLANQARRLRDQDVMATTEVLAGNTASALLAAISPGDLVVMTSRGRGGLRRLVLGSIADQLVRRAPAPLLLVRPRRGRSSSVGT